MKTGGLFSRLMATHLAIAIGALLVLGIVTDRALERRARTDLVARLTSEAADARIAIERTDPAMLQDLVRALGNASAARFTVIARDGQVLADSAQDPAGAASVAGRPEIEEALRGDVGTAERVSETTGVPSLFVALPPSDGIIVRTSLPTSIIAEANRDIRVAMAVSFLALGVIAVGFSVLIARSIARPLSRISSEVERVARGEFLPVEPTGPTEARSLARAVNQMSGELAERLGQLRRETELREQILSSMDEAVILARGTEVVYANPAARELFGVEEMRLLPATIPLPAGGEPVEAGFALHHPRYRDVRSVSVPVGGDTVLVVAQDVTEAKRIERMRRDFVANASHELKTPVSAMLATAETLEDALRHDPDAAKRFAATLTKEARRMSNLVQDLLSLARLEQLAQRQQRVALPAVIRQVVADVTEQIEEKNLSVTLALDERVEAWGSEEDLSLMIRNLLDNAIRYTPENGSIRIEAGADDGEVRVAVRDTGIGIPARDLGRIFERFYRVDKGRSRETGGTGLGLAIVRHVAESHGGTVTAESELGEGSEFTVRLPADPRR